MSQPTPKVNEVLKNIGEFHLPKLRLSLSSISWEAICFMEHYLRP